MAERIVKVRRQECLIGYWLIASVHLEDLLMFGATAFFLAWFKVAETIWIWLSRLSHFSPVPCTPWKPTSTPQEAKKWDPEVDDPLGIGALNPQQPGHVRDLEPTIFWGPIGLTILTHANLTHTWYHDVNPDTVRIDHIAHPTNAAQNAKPCKHKQQKMHLNSVAYVYFLDPFGFLEFIPSHVKFHVRGCEERTKKCEVRAKLLS